MPRASKSPGSALKGSETVPELRKICADYGIDTFGKKAELLERIKEHEGASSPPAKSPAKTPKAKAATPRSRAVSKRVDTSNIIYGDELDANHDGRVTRSEVKETPSSTPSKGATTVAALKAALSELGLSTQGLKSELMARLAEAQDKLSGAVGSLSEPSPAKAASPVSRPTTPVAEESVGESEMGEIVASDASSKPQLWPVLLALAAVIALVAWHLQTKGRIKPGDQ